MTIKRIMDILAQKGGLILRVEIKHSSSAEYATEARLTKILRKTVLDLTCPTRALGTADNLEDIVYSKQLLVGDIRNLQWVSDGMAAFIFRETQPRKELFFK